MFYILICMSAVLLALSKQLKFYPTMSSTVQKAVVITAIGEPAVLINDRKIPQPGPNQVQIKVTVAGINPHDQKSRAWGLFIDKGLPAIVTNDVVGKVSKLGEGVTKLAIGDRVVWQAAFDPESSQKGLQEYAVGDVDLLAKIPSSTSDDEAATLPTNIAASLVALFDTLKIPAPWSDGASSFDYANTSLLIIGGGSNCGR
jgi:NADPH:quinone reductase